MIWSSPVDELDVSIIQLKQQPEGVAGVSIAKSLPPLNVNRVDNKNINIHSSFISIMGYPLGKELQISFNGCRLLTYDDKELQYIADTSPGSAGSPVLDDNWEAIGIHRLRGNLPSLDGNGRVYACQGTSLLAVKERLRKDFG